MSRLRAAAALLAAVLLVALGAASAPAATPSRVVALTPFTANTTSLLGVKPIAIGETLGGNEWFTAGLAGVERLTLSHPFGPNQEELALLNPDLVLSAPVWAKGNENMRNLGVRVVESDPQRVLDVPRQIEYLGKVLGRSASAKEKARTQRRSIAAAMSRARRHPSVLLVLGLGDTIQAFMPNSWGGDVVTAAGGRLITKGLERAQESGFARLSDEIVVERNPDIIIVVPHGTPSNLDRIAADMRNRPAWKNTKAARNKRVFISTDNTLLQANTRPASVINRVQRRYLKNW